MNLKRIEISGFKSFENRLNLDFSGGVTAILGPNGCGKTNIVDAIRWVLGEQKTRLLRNTKMENVIFNGTRTRKPLGMAEVHLILSNEDRALPVDYSEVTISRKLYRDGASEYYVNGELARLKNIRGLLVDTGLGNHTYSIIEREMVDSVISEKEQDKRFLLEEAAGVMRYRIQREEALRKIAHTETDLTRLGDILTELDKEIRSLRYQMGKARRYARLRERLDVMEAALIKRSLFDLLDELDQIKEEKIHHEGITLADENEITIREDRLQELRIEGSETDRRLQDLYENRHDLSRSLQQHEERIAILTERIGSNTNRIREDDEEIERSRTKLGSLGEDLAQFRRVIEGKENELERRRNDLANTEEALREVTGTLETVKAEVRDRKQLTLDLIREKERVRGIREHLEERLREVTEKKQKDEEELVSLRASESRLLERLEESRVRAEEKRSHIISINGTLEKLSRKSERTSDLITKCEDLNSKENIELNRYREKTEFLKRIKTEHTHREDELYSDNTRIKGILADRVRVDKRYRKCFEACLSPVLQALLTESKDDALRCVEDIQVSGNGKVQILYPNGNGDRPKGSLGRLTVGNALDLLTGDDGVTEYLGSYLSGVVVTKDVEDAMSVLQTAPALRVATLDGVFFDGPGRIVVAGSDDVEMTLLEFDSKIEELMDSIGWCEQRMSRLRGRRNAMDNLKDRLGKEAAALRTELREAQSENERALEDRRERELDLAVVKQKITSLSVAQTDYRMTVEEIRSKLSAESEPSHGTDDSNSADMNIADLEARAAELERDKETLGETAGRIRLEIATVTGEISTASEKRKNVEMLDTELRELVVYREEDGKRCRLEIEAANTEISDARGKIERLHVDVEVIEKKIEEAKEAHERVTESCDRLEKELRELKGQRDQKRENVQRCSLEIVTRETRITDLLEKARENLNQDLDPFVQNRDRFEPAEWEELDFDTLEELRSTVETFGPVNMLAVDEFNEKKERFDFLSRQKTDLEEARESLTQAIRRINREARRRLSDTFDKVRQNFKDTFLTLFDGGEADLLFVGSDDPLEANIRIVANPKGKRLHDIASLSGGERALVALSLLFAIYLVKPSPFCVFDEVDAPLDDANIGRFVKLLKSFTSRTQFIVITHNKKTMEAADNLYGVTMQEPGVSRMISVHIGEVDRFRDDNGSRGESVVPEPAAEEVPVHT